MTKDQELQMMARLNAGFPLLKEWLETEQALATKQMAGGVEPLLIGRAQGTFNFIEKFKNLLASAHTHLR